jgi:hypothetical protein
MTKTEGRTACGVFALPHGWITVLVEEVSHLRRGEQLKPVSREELLTPRFSVRRKPWLPLVRRMKSGTVWVARQIRQTVWICSPRTCCLKLPFWVRRCDVMALAIGGGAHRICVATEIHPIAVVRTGYREPELPFDGNNSFRGG